MDQLILDCLIQLHQLLKAFDLIVSGEFLWQPAETVRMYQLGQPPPAFAFMVVHHRDQLERESYIIKHAARI